MLQASLILSVGFWEDSATSPFQADFRAPLALFVAKLQ
jgi:hypothetical protein